MGYTQPEKAKDLVERIRAGSLFLRAGQGNFP